MIDSLDVPHEPVHRGPANQSAEGAGLYWRLDFAREREKKKNTKRKYSTRVQLLVVTERGGKNKQKQNVYRVVESFCLLKSWLDLKLTERH